MVFKLLGTTADVADGTTVRAMVGTTVLEAIGGLLGKNVFEVTIWLW